MVFAGADNHISAGLVKRPYETGDIVGIVLTVGVYSDDGIETILESVSKPRFKGGSFTEVIIMLYDIRSEFGGYIGCFIR